LAHADKRACRLLGTIHVLVNKATKGSVPDLALSFPGNDNLVNAFLLGYIR
jgi:hypothetical protein